MSDVCGLRPSNIYTARFFNKDPGLKRRFLEVSVIAVLDHLNCYVYAMTPMLEHVRAGIQYALGDLKADDSPSVK